MSEARPDGSPRLESAAAATAFQKEWFLSLADRARDGEPIALANADAPHELLRALGIPYVVNQWWSSIISAKRGSPWPRRPGAHW